MRVLHLPDMEYEPFRPPGRRARRYYYPLCGCGSTVLPTVDVADPGDESLADCKRCIAMQAKRVRKSTMKGAR